jgi:hypothetical protein
MKNRNYPLRQLRQLRQTLPHTGRGSTLAIQAMARRQARCGVASVAVFRMSCETELRFGTEQASTA